MRRLMLIPQAVVPCIYTNQEVCDWSGASGVTNGTFLTALDTFISSGKAHGWWATKSQVNILCAGSFGAIKYNVVNIANNTFIEHGSITYTSTGLTSDGSTGYIDMNIIPNNVMTTTSGYMSLYVRTNVNQNTFDMGVSNNGSDAGGTFLVTRYSGVSYGQYGNGSYANTLGSASSIGYWAVLRDGGVTYLYKNGVSVKNTTEAATMATFSAFLSTYNIGGSPDVKSSKEYGLSTMGTKLTSGQASDEYNDGLTFLTAVGAN